jgi:hypothetical protein
VRFFDVIKAGATEYKLTYGAKEPGAILRRAIKECFLAFLESHDYTEWCKDQLGNSAGLLNEEGCTTLATLNLQRSVAVPKYVRFRTMDSEDDHESSSFQALSAFAETISLTVYVSAPNKEAGFPIVYLNAYAEGQTGYSLGDLQGRGNIFMNQISEELTASFVFGIPSVYTHFFSHFDGTLVPVTVVSKPIYDTSTEYRYLLSIQLENQPTEQDLGTAIKTILSLPSLLRF